MVINVNRKKIFIMIVIILLGFIILGCIFTNNNSDNFDNAFYVENSNNIFIVIAKTLDKCCYYIVDAIVVNVTNVFNSLLNN